MVSKSLVKNDSGDIIDKILTIRGQRVMLDSDLALLYQVETKALKRAVKRNMERFPPDFMFELTKEETNILRRQNGTSSWGGSRYLPYAFTEQGVAMLSTVLSSKVAIDINIQIMRAFVSVRQFAVSHQELAKRLSEVEKNVKDHGYSIKFVLDTIDKMLREKKRPQIGFKHRKDQS
ncbi:MAG TPA: ORF6N domain-containing protein [Candidatus Rifleibacterium sp.]|nr:ORF6N domain-containing protein [Candidatus Rifleibacterium sp.]HPT47187.1 ORF6N domain-containing protein [Candidatus Rifleibacterium sp.]